MSPLCLQVSGCQSLRSFARIISSFGTCVSARQLEALEERNPESDKYIVLGKIHSVYNKVCNSTEAVPPIKHHLVQTFYIETFGLQLNDKLVCRVVFIGDIVSRFSEHNLKKNDYIALFNPIVSYSPCGITLTIRPSKPVPIVWYYSSKSDHLEEDLRSAKMSAGTSRNPNGGARRSARINLNSSSEENTGRINKDRRVERGSSKNSKLEEMRKLKRAKQSANLTPLDLGIDSSVDFIFESARVRVENEKRAENEKLKAQRALLSRRSNEKSQSGVSVSPAAQRSTKSVRRSKRLRSSQVPSSSSEVHNVNSSSDELPASQSVVQRPQKRLNSAKVKCPAPKPHNADSSLIEVTPSSSNSDERLLNRQAERSNQDCEAQPQLDSFTESERRLISASPINLLDHLTSNDPSYSLNYDVPVDRSALTPPVVNSAPSSSRADSISSQARRRSMEIDGNVESEFLCCCQELLHKIALLIGCCTHNNECSKNKAIVELLELYVARHCNCSPLEPSNPRETNFTQSLSASILGTERQSLSVPLLGTERQSLSVPLLGTERQSLSVPLLGTESTAHDIPSVSVKTEPVVKIERFVNEEVNIKTEINFEKVKHELKVKEERKFIKTEPGVNKTEMKSETDEEFIANFLDNVDSATEWTGEAPELTEEEQNCEDSTEVQVSEQDVPETRRSGKQAKRTKRRKLIPSSYGDDESSSF